MQNHIDAVVFDLGGVMIDWNPRRLYRKLFRDEAAMERFLTEVCTLEWNASMDAGRPFADAIAELSAAHPDHAEMIGYWHTRWVEMVGDALEGTVEIMRELRQAGLRTFALSNWSAETFPLTRARFPFLDELDGAIISGEVGLAKPDPAIFHELTARYGLSPEATVYIDDWDRNVAVASDLGMIAIRFFDAEQLRHDLRALGLPLAAAEPAAETSAAAE